MIFGYYKNCLYTHRYKLSSEKKKKQVKSPRYMVSHPETSSDPLIGSDRESGRDIIHRHIDKIGTHISSGNHEKQ